MLLVFGFFLMVLGTYANLVAIDEKSSGPSIDDKLTNYHPTESIDIKLPLNLSDILVKPKSNDILPKNSLLDTPVVKEINLEENANELLNNIDVPQNSVTEKPTPKSDILINLLNEQHKKDTAALYVAANDSKKISEEINKDAIAREQQEIEFENREQSHIKEEIGKLKHTKDELAAEVQDMKEKLNEETKQLVMTKLENINKKLDGIEEKQEAVAKNEAMKHPPVTKTIPKENNINNPVIKLLTQKSLDTPVLAPNPIIQANNSTSKDDAKVNVSSIVVSSVAPVIAKQEIPIAVPTAAQTAKIIEEKPVEEIKIGRDLLNTLDKSVELNQQHLRQKRDVDENCAETSTTNYDVIFKTDQLSVPKEDTPQIRFDGNDAAPAIFAVRRDLKSVVELNGTLNANS